MSTAQLSDVSRGDARRTSSRTTSRRGPSLAALLATSLLATPLLAPPAAAQLSTITQAGAGETVQPMLSHQRGLAITSDGRLWSMTYWNDGLNNGEKSQFTRIWSSKDNGKTWTLATSTRTTGSVRGSLCTGVDGRTLHVVWQALHGAAGASVWYAEYDTVAGAWKGADVNLAQGVNANSQYLAPQVDVTKSGTVAVCYYTHRQGPWAGQLRVLKNNTWSPVQKVNVDSYGVIIDHQVHGEDVHLAYRTNAGLYGIRYRRFDTQAMAWGAEGEIQVSQANPNGSPASSGNCIAVAADGDTYVIYSSGTSNQGKIWVGYAKAGSYSFSVHTKLADDPPLTGGNYTYYNYSLMRGQDQRIYAIYSLASENYKNLYMNWLTPTGIGPQIPLGQGVDNQFAWLTGHRNTTGLHGLMATVHDTSHQGGRASFWGSPTNGAIVFHGMGCRGTLQAQPWLGASGIPALGTPIPLELASLPASAPGLLILGLSDNAPYLPLDLAVLGMPGCALGNDLLVTGSYAASAAGAASIKIPLPNDPNLAGVPIFFQSLVIAIGANAGNAVMTNGIAAIGR